MSITIEQAKALKWNDTIYLMNYKDSKGKARKCRVSGEPKTWKRNPNKVMVPLKHGLYDTGYLINEDEEGYPTRKRSFLLGLFEVTLEEPAIKEESIND